MEVVQVGDGTPSARAGLRVGDLLVALDATPLTHAAALHRALRHVAPGTALSLRGAAQSRAASD